MKRVSVLLVIAMVAIWAVPVGTNSSQCGIYPAWQYQMHQDFNTLSSATSSGSNLESVAFMTRSFESQSIQVLNSYASTSQHFGQLDLTDYLIPGWSLYNVTMDVSSITAIAEKETTGISESTYIEISNQSGSITDVLYQAFYNQPHDGRLENYSLDFRAPFYDNSLGEAFLVIRSDYADPQKNVTDWITPFSQQPSFTTVTHDLSSDGIVLNASNYYYAVIDGTVLQGYYSGIWWFNTIYWEAEQYNLGLQTGYHLRDDNWYVCQGLPEYQWEADLDYAYTPWNKTADAALTYLDPSAVSLKGNLTSLNGFKWFFTDASNITAIDFDSGQSVEISYGITLNYRKTVDTSSVWEATGTGQDILWNTTTILAYPASSEFMFLNVSIPSSWSITGLYDATAPTVNHNSREDLGETLRCWNLGNDTWTLTFTSRNYLTAMQTYDASDDNEIISKSSISVDIDINSTLTEQDLDLVSTGTTNLTVQYQGSTIWAPANKTVNGGKTHYLWNIAGASPNGLYTIEEFWSNGTEAGYRTKDLTLYYPTSLVASQSEIDGFTESTFDISVDFDDTYTPQGLDAGYANVVYSFDDGDNTSLTHQSGGTWTATISTAGKANDTYSVQVYAEGYALENRSITINVNLIHDTQSLVILWSNTNNISYVDSTVLSLEYRRLGGAPVTDATVNVTDGSTTWILEYDSFSESYKYTFGGSDLSPGFATHDLTILAWQKGYKEQSNTTQTLTVHEEYTSLVIQWPEGSDISYVQSTTLYVDYLMSNGSAISDALVNVSIDAQPWQLHWNSTSERYWIRFNGTDIPPGFGNHSLTIEAWKYGFEYQMDPLYNLTISRESTSLVITWDTSDTISYIGIATLIANYTMSNGTAVVGADVNVTIGSGSWNMTWNNLNLVYELTIFGNDTLLSLDSHSVFIFAGKKGYDNATDPWETLTIDPEPTSLLINWSEGYNITYIETTTLIVTYRMNDTTPIDNAMIVVVIDGVPYELVLHNATKTYRLTFNGTDNPPGFGTFNLTISAYKYGFENSSNTDRWITFREEPTTIEITWSNGDNITFMESTVLSINFTMRDGSPVTGANVTISIGSDSWIADYDNSSKTYRLQFLGSEEPPGIGVHDLEISALSFGFENKTEIWEVLTFVLEPTALLITWDPDNDITFATYSILSVNYQMGNGTKIIEATINMTIGSDFWEIHWNETSKLYQIRINGSDLPPGFGNHSILIQASKKGFVLVSTNVTVLLRIEPTSLVIEWSNGFEPGFFDYTYLFVDYRNADLGTIYDANINVTIGTYNWLMTWNATAERYQIKFNGSDSRPGVGNHYLLIKAGKAGYTNLENSSMRLILPVIPTSLVLQFTIGNDISYIEQTTLRAFYNMYNTTPVLLADVNVTVDGTPYPLTWNGGTEAYEYTFHGADNPPGFGNYSLIVLAGAVDYEEQSDTSRWLNLKIESTSLDISWSNGFNITYFNQTTLSVRYLMSDQLTPMETAFLNATINGQLYVLSWNISTEAYEATIKGIDDPPGYGTFNVTILASLYGFESQTNSSIRFTIRVQDTYLTLKWDPINIISYVNTTTFRIFYMTNNDPVINASVNVMIGATPWPAEYNDSSGAYEVYFRGTDFIPPKFLLITVMASKVNYLNLIDTSQNLTINEEQTSIQCYWTNTDYITFVGSTTLLVNYTMSNGSEIIQDSWVVIYVRIGTKIWDLTWDSDLKVYKQEFIGDMNPPGLGTHGLYIHASRSGYQTAINTSLILTIEAEDVGISSSWLGNATITYIQSTTLAVNYTTSEGDPIVGATVNVTIGITIWDLKWHALSQTYRITFNGTDNSPGFGMNHELEILAWKDGFNGTSDTTKKLSIIEESTTLTIHWSDPNQNNVSYFSYTFLFVNYRMSNGSDIVGANVNVTYSGTTWILDWNSTEGAFGLRFNGSDNPLGLGTNSLTIRALEYGFEYRNLPEVILILTKDPTSLEVAWSPTDNITYVEQTLLMVYYKMSNDSLISTGALTATIGEDTFPLVWNSSTGAYHFLFTGYMNPPDLGDNMIIIIDAYADIYANSTINTSLTIRKESTTAYVSWITETIDWTESVNLTIEYQDSYGRLIEDASQKIISIDGSVYVLLGTNGTYWFELNNSFDLGLHSIEVNISRYGYHFAVNTSISLNVTKASTTLSIVWSTTTTDYLGQINLEVTYAYLGTGESVPMGSADVNLTIDGITDIVLFDVGNVWVATLTGNFDLNLGVHDIIIRAQAYGYDYQEANDVLNVNPVNTDELTVTWSPSNVTIEFTDRLNLTVDYTFYNGDVSTPAFVNVMINGRYYDLDYLGGVWTVSILGEELDVGLYNATISAWAYGYADRTNLTIGINVTVAANAFIVSWDPWDLTPTYLDTINVSVRYLEDFKPILNATVTLSINGTPYEMTYNSTDQMWHISLKAMDIDLGAWNVTVTANKTGYANGWDSDILVVLPEPTTLTPTSPTITIYYDETTVIDIYYQLANMSVISGASISVTLEGTNQSVILNTDHWSYTGNGTMLDIGIHVFDVGVSLYGYEDQTTTFTIEVERIPTHVVEFGTQIVLVALDNNTLKVNYLDNRTSNGISGALTNVVWPDSTLVQDLDNGSYLIQIFTLDMHIGNYRLNVTFERSGHFDGFISVRIDINPILSLLDYVTTISQYENETVQISVSFRDVSHDFSIDWGTVTIQLEGTTYPLIYEGTTLSYTISLWLGPTINPGTYELELNADATDCLSANGTIELEVLAKATYVLVVESASEISGGDTLPITMMATEDGVAVSGLQIEFQIVATLRNGGERIYIEVMTTNTDGMVTLNFEVPADVSELSIIARFNGSISEWPAESSSIQVEVGSSGSGILTLLLNPMTLALIAGCVSVPLLAVSLRRRRRSSGGLNTPIDTMIESTSIDETPSAGLGDRLRNEIMSSEDGLTRAELSKRLGPSSSKIGVIVKELLSSDSDFYEVREGSKRYIRYRGSE
ncbi:MAG: hypothetical protein KGD60_05460 [Candidatus Thorarchaeota archaeon]|nr:hypothetical protein [Candidatus Thorarchaeota archaeon]